MPDPTNSRTAIRAVQQLRVLPAAERTEFFDNQIAPVIERLAPLIDSRHDPESLRYWLEVQSATLDFAVEGITDITDKIRHEYPEELRQALELLPDEQRARIEELLRELAGEETVTAGEVERVARQNQEFMARRPDLFGEAARREGEAPPADVLAEFVGTGTFQSTRGFTAISGNFLLYNRDRSEIARYDANTGGGAANFRTRNGPVPPGIYVVANHRANRTTDGMVLDGVGYSFDVDPTDGTSVFGRSLFRIHPDGGNPGTNGCIGIRESESSLVRCETQIVELIGVPGPFKMVVRY